MCGITGILTSAPLRGDELLHAVNRMRDTIAHRGPDDAGSWTAESGSTAVALGFRRLSILDLSELGHQPMTSASGRFTMEFNGEVYNFAALRHELEAGGARFRGHSDTEVILAAFERWGVEAAVPRLAGMFAIAVWDSAQRVLYLIRDRLGKKPLFVYSRPGTVLFGSELKALRAGPGFEPRLNPDALTAYLRYLYVPAPLCIYQNVLKLPPGHLLAIRDVDAPLPASRPFWSVEDEAVRGLASPFPGTEHDAVDELERMLQEAVDLRLQSDVPLGALLSGGIDSSTVVALMRQRASGTVKTFTIGFDVAEHDESRHAAAVAKHLGTDHTELRLSGADAMAVVPRLPRMFDEPLADPSQIPTFLVCQLARRDVTVALTGDGGDELFAGYNRYTYGARMLPWAAAMPRQARRLVAAGLGGVSSGTWDRLVGGAGAMFPPANRLRLPGSKAKKLARLLAAGTPAAMYRSLVSAWDDPAAFVEGGVDRPGDLERIVGRGQPAALLDRMMLADQRTYLADDLLAKVDRASMAVSLEARVPLLDHRLVEFAWTIPARWKVRDGQGKWLLRQVLYRHVPRELVERPKVGFSVPIDVWLRGPLRGWAEDMLSENRLRRGNVLRANSVRDAWRRFLGGEMQLAPGIWSLLSYQAWEQEWLPGGATLSPAAGADTPLPVAAIA